MFIKFDGHLRMPTLNVSIDVGRVIIFLVTVRTSVSQFSATFVFVEIGDSSKAGVAVAAHVVRKVWQRRGDACVGKPSFDQT